MKYKWSDSDTASGEVAAGSTWQRVTVTPEGPGREKPGAGAARESGIVPGGIQLRWRSWMCWGVRGMGAHRKWILPGSPVQVLLSSLGMSPGGPGARDGTGRSRGVCEGPLPAGGPGG